MLNIETVTANITDEQWDDLGDLEFVEVGGDSQGNNVEEIIIKDGDFSVIINRDGSTYQMLTGKGFNVRISSSITVVDEKISAEIVARIQMNRAGI